MEKKMEEVMCVMSTKVVPEENYWIDEYGVKYSADRKKLIEAGNCTSKNYKVKKGTVVICDYAFWWGDFTSIVIPETVKCIGDSVFRCCKLLKNIDLPDSLEYIGKDVFKGCDSLISINALNNKDFKSIDGVLYSADLKTLIKYPIGKENSSFCIPNGVERIEDKAFEDCQSLKLVNIPEGVRCIGEKVFEGCVKLRNINISKSVMSVGKDAFNLFLLKVSIPKGTMNKFKKLLSEHKDKLVECSDMIDNLRYICLSA